MRKKIIYFYSIVILVLTISLENAFASSSEAIVDRVGQGFLKEICQQSDFISECFKIDYQQCADDYNNYLIERCKARSNITLPLDMSTEQGGNYIVEYGVCLLEEHLDLVRQRSGDLTLCLD